MHSTDGNHRERPDSKNLFQLFVHPSFYVLNPPDDHFQPSKNEKYLPLDQGVCPDHFIDVRHFALWDFVYKD